MREFWSRFVLALRAFWVVMRTGSVPVIEIWQKDPPFEIIAAKQTPGRIVLSPEHAVRTVLRD